MKKKICGIGILALIALVASLSIKVATNENRLLRTKAWLGLGTPPSSENAL